MSVSECGIHWLIVADSLCFSLKHVCVRMRASLAICICQSVQSSSAICSCQFVFCVSDCGLHLTSSRLSVISIDLSLCVIFAVLCPCDIGIHEIRRSCLALCLYMMCITS